jgi:hypothetical protein
VVCLPCPVSLRLAAKRVRRQHCLPHKETAIFKDKRVGDFPEHTDGPSIVAVNVRAS